MDYQIIDIRHALPTSCSRPSEEESSKMSDIQQVIQGLCSDQSTTKRLPTILMYDDLGLQLFDKITYLPEYYLTRHEMGILEKYQEELTNMIPDKSILIELGSGSLRKTQILLGALDRASKSVEYYALDLCRDELAKSLEGLRGYKHVRPHGLWGTYDDGIEYLTRLGNDKVKTIMWLGSSIGNLNRDQATDMLRRLRKKSQIGDRFLIAFDMQKDRSKLSNAYNDPKGVSKMFTLNALDNCNRLISQQVFDRSMFEFVSYVDPEGKYHEGKIKSIANQNLSLRLPKQAFEGLSLNQAQLPEEDDEYVNYQLSLKKGEEIHVEYSFKYNEKDIDWILSNSGLTSVKSWKDSTNTYSLQLAQVPPFTLSQSLRPSMRSLTSSAIQPRITNSLPTGEEWDELWKAWNFFVDAIDQAGLSNEKPIDLRHPFVFYFGHIPAFLDIQLSKYFQKPFTPPDDYCNIFERGIDPDVDDPDTCHPHSEVPSEWPETRKIREYQMRVRERWSLILADPDSDKISYTLARVICMVFEHQAMHLETLLYMVVQLPTPILTTNHLMTDMSSRSPTRPAKWVTMSSEQVSIGHNDPEDPNLPDDWIEYGWDNERPARKTLVDKFDIQSRPVTNKEYLDFHRSTNQANYPASWTVNQKGELFVRTIFGPIKMEIAANWPVFVSHSQASQYAQWIGCQLPSEAQLLRARDSVDQSNDKRQIGYNTGFKNWHPLPVRSDLDLDLFGDGWEWTSTKFDKYDGFNSSPLYPGYSQDFFDGKHFVCLGGSWATHSRLVQRRSFRNWYQSKYPFMFATFRCIKSQQPTQMLCHARNDNQGA